MVKWSKEKHIWKFLLVGVINTLVGSSVMFISYNVFGFSYWISTAANYVLGSILSYLLNKRFTFQSREKSIWEAVKFICHIIICYFIAYGLAKSVICFVFTERKLQENVSMMIGMGLFVCLNYAGQRWFVFRPRKKRFLQ